MTKRAPYLLFILLTIFYNISIFSQGENKIIENSQLEASFVKSEINQKTDELSFNVVSITNYADKAISVKPRLTVPDGFALFSTAFTDTIIPANSTIKLPYRLRISAEASGNTEHTILFRLFSEQNQLLLENTTLVKPEAFHSWEVNLPKNRVFFYPRFNLAEFEVVLTNNGNVGEVIILSIEPDKKLSFADEMESDWRASQSIFLAPKTDSIVTFKVNYTYQKDRIFDVSKVRILATGSDKEIVKTAFIEKYVDEYSTMIVDYTLPHVTEVGVRSRTISNTQEVEPFINTRGIVEFKENSSFNYYFSNYRLNQPDNFVENSNYRFLYTTSKGLSFGLGNFGSQLGRNLYSRNAAMIDYKTDIGRESQIEGYASYDYINPQMGGAVGYWWENKKYNLHTTGSYNVNQVLKLNTASFTARSEQIPIYKQQNLTAVFYGLREDYYYENKYSQQGFAWDLNYVGNIGTRFRFKVINNFGSPDIPSNQMGLFNIATSMAFFTRSLFTFFSSDFYYISRNFYYRDIYGDKLPNIYLQDEYINILYNNHKNINFIWSLGPSAESYFALRPELADSKYSRYDIQRYLLEYKSYMWKDLRVNLDAGVRNIYYEGSKTIDTSRLDIHFVANYNHNGIGFKFQYDYGALANKGLYQRVTDLNYNGISIGPYIISRFARNRFNFQLYTNYTYRFDLDYSYLNISPFLEAYLVRNWYAKISGNYTWYKQELPEYSVENSNYFVAFSVVKKWGKSEFYKKQKQLRRLKVICFKDENGNGVKDKNEEGIPHIKTRLKLINDAVQPGHKSFPIDIALLTNEEGYVIFNQIPKGFYDLDVIPLTDLKEYFYVSETFEQVDLVKNMTFFIPFQKASQIEGKLDVKQAKFSNENLDLSRIKITAYNKAGNSYSAFTRQDGAFTIYVPGDTTYFLRMENVFGNKFKILQNDIPKKVPDPTNRLVVFNIVEKSKQINFKKATPDGPKKTKFLKGKIYENTDRKVIDIDALPMFDMGDGTAYERNIAPGITYVILAQNVSREDALKAIGIFKENGIDAYFGFDEGTKTHYVFKDQYPNQNEAQKGLKELKDKGVKNAFIMEFK